MTLQFVAYHEGVTEAPFVSVDGVMCVGHPNETLNLAHWHGNSTPPYLKAKTTVEMALKLIRFSNWRSMLGPAKILSNNHYDTDGVLAAWVLLAPDIAPRYAEKMIAACIAGDYGVFTTPFGVKFDLLLTHLEDYPSSPIYDQVVGKDEVQASQILYDWVLARLPDLFDQIDTYRDLWEDIYAEIEGGLRAIAAGRATIREHPEAVLSVIEMDRWLHVMARRSRTQGGRLLSICKQADGTLFELQYTLFTFHDVPDRPSIQRPNLTHVAERFNQLETSSAGQWVFDDSYDPTHKLHYVDANGQLVPSQLNASMVERSCVEMFAKLGDPWPYYDEAPWGRIEEGQIVSVIE